MPKSFRLWHAHLSYIQLVTPREQYTKCSTERTVTSQDDDALAEECLPLWIGETLQGGLIAIIRAQNLGGRREIDLVLGIRTEIAILIYYIYFYEGCRG